MRVGVGGHGGAQAGRQAPRAQARHGKTTRGIISIRHPRHRRAHVFRRSRIVRNKQSRRKESELERAYVKPGYSRLLLRRAAPPSCDPTHGRGETSREGGARRIVPSTPSHSFRSSDCPERGGEGAGRTLCGGGATGGTVGRPRVRADSRSLSLSLYVHAFTQARTDTHIHNTERTSDPLTKRYSSNQR